MNSQFRTLRLTQLDRALHPFLAAKDSPRPQRGWIRAIREATGITMRELAQRLGKVPSQVASFEKSEAEYRITLGSLRAAAEALGCELVYAFVPKTTTKSGSVHELVEARARAEASENVRAVEHSMSLEDQAVGGVEEMIEEETRRILNASANR
jgi:predicted DNA-binding mobile mystery protein A